MGMGICSFLVLGIGIFMSFITGNWDFYVFHHWEWGFLYFSSLGIGIFMSFITENGIFMSFITGNGIF